MIEFSIQIRPINQINIDNNKLVASCFLAAAACPQLATLIFSKIILYRHQVFLLNSLRARDWPFLLAIFIAFTKAVVGLVFRLEI